MNAQAMQIAQAMHDNASPVEIDDGAGQRWLDTSTEQLVGGVDVCISRWGKPDIVITHQSLVQAVDEHIMTRIADNQIDTFALGALALLAGKRGDVSELLVELLGPSDHYDGMRYEIADRLLRPHLAAALEEIAEDNAP